MKKILNFNLKKKILVELLHLEDKNYNNVGMLLRRLVNYTTGEKITTFCRRTFC